MNTEQDKFLTDALEECWYEPSNLSCGTTNCDKTEPHDLHCWVCSGPLIVNTSREAYITNKYHSATFCDAHKCQEAADYRDSLSCGVPPVEIKRRLNGGIRNSNIDFSTWEGFGKLWEWAKKQEWWHKEFLYKQYMGDLKLIHPDRFADAVYTFLTENSSLTRDMDVHSNGPFNGLTENNLTNCGVVGMFNEFCNAIARLFWATRLASRFELRSDQCVEILADWTIDSPYSAETTIRIRKGFYV